MNKPLPEIVCNKCHKLQTYTGQGYCKSCNQRLNNVSVVKQLREGKLRMKKTEPASWRDP